MSISLPSAIDAYFAADRASSPDAVADCFAETAVVKDEGHTSRGRATIRRWKNDASSEYSYTVEPRTIAVEGDRTVVTSRVTGNFPGSPVDLRYLFVIEGDTIAELEIVP